MTTSKTPAVHAKNKASTGEENSTEWKGAFSAYGTAFERIKRSPKPLLWFMGAYAVLTLFSDAVQDQPYTDLDYVNYGDMLFIVFLLAVVTYALSIADNKTISLREAVRFNAKKYLVLWVTMILFALIVAGSLLLLIVPAIWTIAWFMLSSYAVVDKGLGPVDALKESKRLAQRHKAKVWGIIGVSILASFVAAFIAFVPYIGPAITAAVSIWSAAAAAMLYRWLQQQPVENKPVRR